MTKPMVRIHNAETNEVIDREMTAEEFAAYEIEQAKGAEFKASEASKASAKEALLERLGITEAEAALLLG
jgi:hydroxymethylpyrimidine pyrophosphatase-like HAD family hydrolase